MAEIVTAVDEPLETLRCKSKSKGCMPGGARCLTHDLWEALGSQIHVYLSSVSLEDVCQKRLFGGPALTNTALAGAAFADHGSAAAD